MKSSKGSMAHRVITLLKMVLREFLSGEDAAGVTEASVVFLLTSALTLDTFWDMSRRFVKYCRSCREESWNSFLLFCSRASVDPGLG